MRPLFIGGCERSGTTMLGAMVGAHSQCVCVPESQFIEQLLENPGFDPDAVDPVKTLAEIAANRRYRLLWNLPLGSEISHSLSGGTTYSQVVTSLVRAYAAHIGKPDAVVWVDQTPTNFRRALLLLRLFPDARFIHLVRDGRGVAASLLPLDWGPNNVMHAAEFWMARCAPGFAAELSLGSGRVLRIRYEDLVSEPEAELRRAAGLVGLDYQPSMSAGSGHRPGRYNESQHALVGRAPVKAQAHRWQRALTRREIEIFEAEAGDLLKMLGYQREFELGPRPAKQGEVLRMRLGDLLRRIRNNLRRRWRAYRALHPPGK